MVMPLKLRAVAPAVSVAGVVPAQVPPMGPPTADMFTSASVNAPPVSATELVFPNVNVTVEVPPAAIVAGLNALAIVGDDRPVTVKLAVLLTIAKAFSPATI